MKRLFIVTLKLYEEGKPDDLSKLKFATIAESIEEASTYVRTRWTEIDEPEKGFEWKSVHTVMSDLDLLIPKLGVALVSIPKEAN